MACIWLVGCGDAWLPRGGFRGWGSHLSCSWGRGLGRGILSVGGELMVLGLFFVGCMG